MTLAGVTFEPTTIFYACPHKLFQNWDRVGDIVSAVATGLRPDLDVTSNCFAIACCHIFHAALKRRCGMDECSSAEV